jgi:hypothetical protein
MQVGCRVLGALVSDTGVLQLRARAVLESPCRLYLPPSESRRAKSLSAGSDSVGGVLCTAGLIHWSDCKTTHTVLTRLARAYTDPSPPSHTHLVVGPAPSMLSFCLFPNHATSTVHTHTHLATRVKKSVLSSRVGPLLSLTLSSRRDLSDTREGWIRGCSSRRAA